MSQIGALFIFSPNTVIVSARVNSNFADIKTAYNAHDTATTAVHGITSTVAGIDEVQTFTNKTLTSPTINTGTMDGSLAGTAISASTSMALAATVRLYFDGVGAAGNTYIYESAADQLDIIVGNARGLRFSEGATDSVQVGPSYDLTIESVKRLYFDGTTGGDTYISESAANQLDTVVGNNRAVRILAGEVQVGPSFDLVVEPTKSIFLDGAAGGDTYFRELAADVVIGVSGNNEYFRSNASGELLFKDVDPPTANYANRNGIVRAWIDYADGAPGSIRNSYNVDSVTGDDGDGIYVINWDTDFTNNDYAIGGISPTGHFIGSGTLATSSLEIKIENHAGVLTDNDFHLMVIGDQ